MRRGFALIEVVIAGVILAVGLAGIINVSMRAMEMQRRGEAEVIASSLLDGLLSQVLVDGVTEFPKLNATSGRFDPPFEDWEWELVIDKQGAGDPYRVMAIARDRDGAEFRVETLMAARPENTEEPQRAPTAPIDRQARYDELP